MQSPKQLADNFNTTYCLVGDCLAYALAHTGTPNLWMHLKIAWHVYRQDLTFTPWPHHNIGGTSLSDIDGLTSGYLEDHYPWELKARANTF